MEGPLGDLFSFLSFSLFNFLLRSTPMIPVEHADNASQQTILCSYEDAYLPIYETSYDISFIFCDEEELCLSNKAHRNAQA